MKFVSVFLTACMLLLSFAGGGKPAVNNTSKKICCHQMDGKRACKGSKSDDHNKPCDNPACAMMLSCSICGFLIVDPLQCQPNLSHYIAKPVSLYKIGNLSAYHQANWKPPKTC